ncbi:hypothetical protein HD597_005087 [Nonomuraea thailandensis]|uniref:Uncharacterized protein n=1 Tax=Nonomuraea thailandensis TaxID=1188745 RepID=A0A9X2GGE1_9ACTN|nr:hypothetical protein [Nonomuraea thailandensis]MCP2358067.1 hypothetical protein [Nonomuraea thailandensis]
MAITWEPERCSPDDPAPSFEDQMTGRDATALTTRPVRGRACLNGSSDRTDLQGHWHDS